MTFRIAHAVTRSATDNRMVSPPGRSRQTLLHLAFWTAFAGTLAFSAWYAWFSWHHYEKTSRYRLQRESNMLAGEIQRILDGHAATLRLLGQQMLRKDTLHHPRLARSLLSEYQMATPDIASATLIAPDGQVIASTAVPEGQQLPDFRKNPAIWPGLQEAFHGHGVLPYRPLRGPLVDGNWVIRFRYPVFSPDGKPKFVLATPIFSSSIQNLLRHLPLHPEEAIGLVLDNSTLEGRWPVPGGNLTRMLSRPMQPGPLLHELQVHPAQLQGSYEGRVMAGHHIWRSGVFTRLAHYPLTVFASIPRTVWITDWWRRQIQFPLIFLLVALGFALTSYWRILSLERQEEEYHRNTENLLSEQATHDELTGLLNRNGLRLVFDQFLARADRKERLAAVCFLDIDNFKSVNDTYGHASGDRLLQEVVERLQNTVRRTDTIARPGGDEFVLLLEELRSVEELEKILARVQAAFAQSFSIHEEQVQLGASMGLTIYPFDESDIDILLRHADMAMYAAKERADWGKGFWTQIYYPDMGTVGTRTEILRQNFLAALKSGAIVVRYQPLVSLQTGRMAGLEALTRWLQDGEELSPTRFLPSLGKLEREELGKFVLKAGLGQMAQWREMGLDLFLSINVTPEELGAPYFSDSFFAIMAGHPAVTPRTLVLEVLEVGELLEQDTVSANLQRLRRGGVRIALDDMGSAYASFMRLKNLPIDEIKIDQGFIRELPNRPQDLVFVDSLVNLGRSMNLTIVVEGVESAAHIALLREMDVQYVQGYAIARPMEPCSIAGFARTFTLPEGDMDALLPVLYRHQKWVQAAEEATLYSKACIDDRTVCPITDWLLSHTPGLPELDVLLAEHDLVHRLVQDILQMKYTDTADELHHLLSQMHDRAHLFEKRLEQAIRTAHPAPSVP